MLRKKLKKFIDILGKYKFRLLALLASYLLVTEVVLKFPYFNLFVFDIQWRVFIFYVLIIIWLRPSYNLLIFASIFFLVFGNFGEVTGILIYISLLLALIKLFKYEKRA